ncbi:MAG: class I SAM-dependent methyltransferase [Candidatus Wildermuthbacteria bacterium]|nr:class I SAM-dependent methyltransferase [Candidatus Wildermuthbacteria bacterium]
MGSIPITRSKIRLSQIAELVYAGGMSRNSMNAVENSAEMWNGIWEKIPSQFSGSKTLEAWYRRIVYFSAFDTLLNLLPPSNQILELGSGTGRNSAYLAKRYSAQSVTLLDFSESALGRTREEDFSCALIKIQQDLLRFTPQKQYGFVHSTGLIEHFTGQERRAVVQKHAECVAPGGYVMIWVPVQSPAFFVIGQFNKLMGIEEVPLTETELKTLLMEARLKIIGENHAVFGALYGVLAQKV